MKAKWVILSICGVFFLSALNQASGAINTRKIDEVLKKSVLGPQDFQIIDSFVAEAVGELVKTKDFSEVGKVRTVILERTSSKRDSARAQYEGQFFESAHKHISDALEQASRLTPEDRRFKVTLNLLILIDRLQNLRLADLAVGMLRDENTVIRYLAVHSVTNAAITRKLNSGNVDSSKLARRIINQFKELVESSSHEIIALMAEFAADVRIPQGEDLLLQIADMRIRRYADWTVDDELLDETVLKSLCEKIFSAGQSKPEITRRFGQLYSYVMQRYIKVINEDNLSADTARQQMVSVLVEVERTCIGKLLEKPQSTIRKAIERGNITGLLLEHSRLLGDKTRPGALCRKYGFQYLDRNGTKSPAPVPLPEPPKLIPKNKEKT